MPILKTGEGTLVSDYFTLLICAFVRLHFIEQTSPTLYLTPFLFPCFLSFFHKFSLLVCFYSNLRELKVFKAGENDITELPPEIGMVVIYFFE